MRAAAALLLTTLLAGCLPAPGPVLSGPWQGCVVSADGTTIDCPYRHAERGSPTPAGPIDEPPKGDPPLTPGPPVDVPPVDPPPSGPPPTDPPPGAPPPVDEPPTDPPPAGPPACKPGWGHGDPNHCHDGPPGRV